jgi:hypothetical protein
MASKKPAINIPLDDIAKLAKSLTKKFGAKTSKKMLSGMTTKRAGMEYYKQYPINSYLKYPTSPVTKPAKKAGAAVTKAKPKPKVKPQSNVPTSKPSAGMSPKKPKTLSKPSRPKRDYIPKGKTMAQTAAEQRAAQKRANQILRRTGDAPTPRPRGSAVEPSNVRGSIIQPPRKATMRPPKPSKASYEADALKAEIRADMNKFGRGQKPKGGKRKPPPEGGVAAKKPKKPKSPSGGSAANRAAFRKAEAEFIKNYLASRTGVKL